MKKVFKILLLTLFLSTISSSCASVVRVAPVNRATVVRIKPSRVVVHNNRNYYYHQGVWYTKSGRNYRRTTLPTGFVVASLPRGYKIIKRRGINYYLYNGIYYKRNRKGYVVVNV